MRAETGDTTMAFERASQHVFLGVSVLASTRSVTFGCSGLPRSGNLASVYLPGSCRHPVRRFRPSAARCSIRRGDCAWAEQFFPMTSRKPEHVGAFAARCLAGDCKILLRNASRNRELQKGEGN